jgi:hypothetical protein
MSGLGALSDSEYTAAIDTIEDGFATVFFEQDGKGVGDAIVAADTLPIQTQHADAILTFEVSDITLSQATQELDRTRQVSK